MEKQCFKCKETKLLSEFYIHPQMGDGHLNKCKTCAKRDVADRVLVLKNNPEWIRAERHRCRLKQERYRMRGLAKQTSSASKKLWEQKNKHKRRAQGVAQKAYLRGEIAKPIACEKCNMQTSKLHKHHPDYSRPKFVIWLCPPCHGREHRKDK